MDELNNNVATEEMTEVVAPAEEMTEITPAPEKKGLTKGQLGVGLGVIGFAIFGLIQLVRLIIKGVKKVVAKIRGKKADKEEAPKQDTTEEIDPDDIVEAEVIDDDVK